MPSKLFSTILSTNYSKNVSIYFNRVVVRQDDIINWVLRLAIAGGPGVSEAGLEPGRRHHDRGVPGGVLKG